MKKSKLLQGRHIRGRTLRTIDDATIFSEPSSKLLPLGSVDLMSRGNISGWTWNPLNPNECLTVDIYDGDERLIRLKADLFRGDLKDAGIGTGRYGFSVPNPSVLLPHARHQISVRRAHDGVDLPGSPQWLISPELGFDESTLSFLEKATTASASIAQLPTQLDQHLTWSLRILNHVLDARQRLNGNKPLISESSLQELLEEAKVSDWIRELIAKLPTEYTPLHFEEHENPTVSIVIPVHNQFPITYGCLQSIERNLPKCSIEIVIVDDYSSDETLFSGFLFSGAVKILRNSKNQGYVGSCNAGAAHATGRYIHFLNNDTLVQPHWLDELVDTFMNVPNVGVVGSKLLFENGLLQEAGGLIWRLGDGCNWGRESDPSDPRYCYLRDCDYVSGAALIIERELFERLNGFDGRYSPAYYEDSDLCFRVRSGGKRVVYQPASEVVHLEGISSGKDVRGIGMKRFQAVNHHKFYERWKETLSAHRYNGDATDLEAERVVSLRAIFIDDTVPTPDQDAGSNAAFQHMLALMRLGYKMTFIPADNMARINPYTANLQKIGIECLYGPYFNSVEDVFRKAGVKPDLVYLHRFSNATKYANLVRRYFPSAFVVYSIADLHSLRQEREMAVTGRVSDAVISREVEIAAMRQVDSVIVHSFQEADLLRREASDLRVHTVPWSVAARPPIMPFDERSDYAFIGGYNHRPNVDAVRYLAEDIAPQLYERNASITGWLVGSKPPPELASMEAANLKFLGFVPDLTALLHRLRCTVAPLRYGAGVKGKVLESFAHGLPCVMSEVAAEGLRLPRSMKWLVARTPSEFASKISILHDDKSLNTRLASDAIAFIHENYSDESTQALIGEAILRQSPRKRR